MAKAGVEAVRVRPEAGSRFNGAQVFSAAVADRARLGEKVTEWIAAHPE
jgi:hypothetical protein